MSKTENVNLYQYLQQLPLSSDGKKLIDLPPDQKQEALDLAWEAFTTGDFQQRWEVAKFLPKFGESAIAPLVQLLEDETANVDLRCEAAAILSKFNARNAIFALTNVLESESPTEVITACANALANNGKTAIPTLTNALRDSHTRLAAVQALAYIRQPETIDPLLTVLNDPQTQVRITAIEALSSFRHPQINKALMTALQDVNATVRKEAVLGLGVRGRENNADAIIEALTPLLYDLDLEVCSSCAIALGKLGTTTAITALEQCLHSSFTPTALKQQIVRGLSHTENEHTLSVLASNLQQQPSSIIQEIIAVLGRWKNPAFKASVAKTLIKFFQEDASITTHQTIKQTLAVALGNLGTQSGKDLLWELTQDETPMVQLHAQAALKKLP